MNTTAFLLQSATGITLKCDGIITNCESLVFYKLRQLSYYKMLHGLLKIATGITKYDGFIKDCDRSFPKHMIITNCDSTRDSYPVLTDEIWEMRAMALGKEFFFFPSLDATWTRLNLPINHRVKQEKRLGTSLRQYKVLPSTHSPTFLKAGAILLVRVPATIITSAWRWKKQKKNKYIRKQWIQFARFCSISQKLFKNRRSDFQCCGVNKLYVVFRGIMTRRVLVKETLFSSGYQTTTFNVLMTRTMKGKSET